MSALSISPDNGGDGAACGFSADGGWAEDTALGDMPPSGTLVGGVILEEDSFLSVGDGVDLTIRGCCVGLSCSSWRGIGAAGPDLDCGVTGRDVGRAGTTGRDGRCGGVFGTDLGKGILTDSSSSGAVGGGGDTGRTFVVSPVLKPGGGAPISGLESGGTGRDRLDSLVGSGKDSSCMGAGGTGRDGPDIPA